MRILLADDEPKVRFALRVLLQQQAGCEVVGEIEDAEELVAQAGTIRPDMVLLHWRMRDLSSVDLLYALKSACPDLYVVALSGRPEARRAAIAAGADAFVSKMDSPDQLLATIDDCWHRRQAQPGRSLWVD